MRRRKLLLSVTLVVALAAGLTGAAAGKRSTVVAFAVRGNPAAKVTTSAGITVSFVARATMRLHDHLVIFASRGSESNLRRVASCPLSPCPGSWRETTGIGVRFQAVLKRGSGIVARSRIIHVTWKAPPPQPPKPPPPAALPGHYEGRTSDNEIFRFDITPDGLGLTNLQTGQINQTCDPPNSLSGGNIGPLSQTFPVTSDGSFTISGSGATFVDTNPATYRITISGHVSGAIAAGTLHEDTGFTARGVSYTCTSGNLAWTASKA